MNYNEQTNPYNQYIEMHDEFKTKNMYSLTYHNTKIQREKMKGERKNEERRM